MSKPITVDFYYLEDSTLLEYFKSLGINDIKFNYIKQNDFDGKPKSGSNVIFFEEDSYVTSLELFQSILSAYKIKSAAIIFSSNKDIFNVIQWMRKGASDYLLINKLKKDIIENSIKSSLDYINYDKGAPKKSIDTSKFPLIKIPDQIDWHSLDDNSNYDLAIVMFEVIIKNQDRYSKSFIEGIYKEIKAETGRIASIYGGKLWFWSNNFGAAVFYFENYIDCSVLSAINFYNNFFLFCIEKLSLKEVLDFKIVINEGNCIFNNTNTDHITSDVINTLTHITKKFTKNNCLNITENVFKKLNPRLKTNFLVIEKFQKNKIYQYKFFDY